MKRMIAFSIILLSYCAVFSQASFKKALYLDGDGDFVEFFNDIITTQTFTIEAHVNMFARGGGELQQNPIFEQRDDYDEWSGGSSAILFEAETHENVTYLAIRDEQTNVNRISFPSQAYQEWHDYAVIVSVDSVFLYIDGMIVNKMAKTILGSFTTSIDYIDIGRHRFNNIDYGFFNGLIDEVRIWDHDLSAKQLESIKNDTLSADYYSSPDSGLVGYWRFDKVDYFYTSCGFVKGVRDLSQGHHDGMLVGDATIVSPQYDPTASILCSIDWVKTDTTSVVVPLNVDLAPDQTFTTASMNISGYGDLMDFIAVIPDTSRTGAEGWSLQTSESDNSLFINFKSMEPIGGKGIILYLIFNLKEDSQVLQIPLLLRGAEFNATNHVELLSGGVQRISRNYGDINFDGIINESDAHAVLDYLTGFGNLSEDQLALSEVSLNNQITAFDASLILLKAKKRIQNLPYPNFPDATNASGTLSLASLFLIPKQTVRIPVYLTNGENIYSFETEWSYNPSFLKFEKFEQPVSPKSFVISSENTENSIKVVGANINPVGGTGLFAMLTFRVRSFLPGDETTIKMESLRFNENDVVYNACSTLFPVITDVADDGTLPTELKLYQNYPNPFNSLTKIDYSLNKAGPAEFWIYNITGKEIRHYIQKSQQPGLHSIVWDGKDDNGMSVSSGLYFLRFKFNQNIVGQKQIIYLK